MKQEAKKTAIITGSSSRGIGKETAIILAKKSVNVVVCSRTQSEITSAVEEINKLTGNSAVLGIRCDVSIPSQVNSLVKSTIDKFESNTIDILVNNAGVAFNRKLIDTSEEEWDQTINSNLNGAFLFTKAVLPYMISNRSGVILNVNSVLAKRALVIYQLTVQVWTCRFSRKPST
jgi:3-oxoacyl-[acyl-carrier protein] reductase